MPVTMTITCIQYCDTVVTAGALNPHPILLFVLLFRVLFFWGVLLRVLPRRTNMVASSL